LLDMQLQISGAILQFFATVFNALEINADLFQRVGQGNAVFVFERAGFVHVEIAGAGGRAEQAFAEGARLLHPPNQQGGQ